MIGETVSHYRLLQCLGQGGMGEVYLAEDLRLHRPVALKMLLAEKDKDPQARARLLREAQAASALNHPNIAVIHEVDEVDRGEGPLRFIVMEFVAGETLAQFARRQPLDLDGVLGIVRQIADALSEAHGKGVVHRDVKPANVMVTESGRVKVLDFGLAQHHPQLDEMASTWSREPADPAAVGALMGTVAYMSPEQARGEEIDARSDIFSLGVVFYELLAGRLPFTGSTAVAVFDALLREDPPPLPATPADPRLPDVERILRRMLAKRRDERYQNLQELVGDLAAVERGAAPRSAPLPPLSAAVAVVGFANITKNGEDDWLGAGIAETVTADLNNVGGIAAVGGERVRGVLRKLGLTDAEPDEIVAVRLGRELGVRWVLSGGFQRLGDGVRVTARLADAETGAVARTVKIDGRMGDIFDLQDRIVRELSSGLRLTLAHRERGAEETHVLEAYEAFSKGVLNMQAETYESLDRAVLFLERAIALDPAYARAHMELAAAYASKADYLVAPVLHERALAQYRRALELRPDLVLAWRGQGSVLVSLGREDEGIEAIRRALALDPDDAGALSSMARALFVGKADFAAAAAYYEQALRRNPQAGWAALQLSHCAALLRDFPRGESAGRRAVELQEAFLSGQERMLVVGAHMRLGHLASCQGRFAEAIEHLQRELAFLQRVDHALRSRILIELHMRLGSAQLRLGKSAEAEAAFAVAIDAFEARTRLGADEPFTRYYAAGVHALRGETERALAGLEKAASQRRLFTIARARIEPEFASLRGEPRFRALLGEA